MAVGVLHHVALLAAGAALIASGWRAAGALGAAGLERAVAAAPLVAAAVVLEAVALGLVGLGGSAAALLAAAILTWIAVARSVRAPRFDALGRWRTLDARQRALLGASAGVLGCWAAWLVKHPALAIDPLTYHLPESVSWVQQGSPGSVELLSYAWPQGNYPLTNEVLVAWMTALGRSFAPALLWTLVVTALGAAAAWLGLRNADVPRLAAVLAIAAVLLVPIAATQQLGPHTDLPALAWLTTAAALAFAAPREPRLLAPAVVAVGLAVGTKTTVAPLAAAALVAGGWMVRGRLRSHWPLLILAAVVAVLCGGIWYVRNLVEHGSPLWPFVAAPWGDPVPPLIEEMSVSLLERPSPTLDGRWSIYVDVLGGALLLLAAIPLTWLLARTRAVAIAAVTAGLAALVWLNAPFTGAAPDPVVDLSVTTTRYLLPAVGAAALALALAARDGGRIGGRLAVALLGFATLLSLGRSLALTFPGVPPLAALVLGALAGAVGLAAAGHLFERTRRAIADPGGRHPERLRVAAAVAVALATLVTAGGLTAAGHDFAERHAAVGRLSSSSVVSWLATRPGFSDGDAPVAFAPQALGVLAGDDLEHRIEVIPADEPCPRVRGRVRRGWVVIGSLPFASRMPGFTAGRCLKDLTPRYSDELFSVYSDAAYRRTASER